jgi:hypothetical protein
LNRAQMKSPFAPVPGQAVMRQPRDAGDRRVQARAVVDRLDAGQKNPVPALTAGA